MKQSRNKTRKSFFPPKSWDLISVDSSGFHMFWEIPLVTNYRNGPWKYSLKTVTKWEFLWYNLWGHLEFIEGAEEWKGAVGEASRGRCHRGRCTRRGLLRALRVGIGVRWSGRSGALRKSQHSDLVPPSVRQFSELRLTLPVPWEGPEGNWMLWQTFGFGRGQVRISWALNLQPLLPLGF